MEISKISLVSKNIEDMAKILKLIYKLKTLVFAE